MFFYLDLEKKIVAHQGELFFLDQIYRAQVLTMNPGGFLGQQNINSNVFKFRINKETSFLSFTALI